MLKLGIIGCGTMGKAHAASAKDSPYVRVTAVCDVFPEAAKSLAEQMNAAAYTDVQTMLDKEELDAVIIATPDGLHAEPFIACCKAKKAIMLEKPFATDPEDGKRMIAAMKENGNLVQMAHLFRFLPFYINMKNAAESGELGELISSSGTSIDRIFVPTKMLKWAGKTSPSWFLLSHLIDAILWIFAEKPVKVRATGIKKKLVSMGIDTYDVVKAEVTLASGAVCSFEGNWIYPNSWPIMAGVMMSVTGTEGTISTNTMDPIMQKGTASEYSIPGILEYEIGGYRVGLRRNMLEAFARTILNKTETVAPAEDGYEAMKVLCAIDRSMQEGGREVLLEQD